MENKPLTIIAKVVVKEENLGFVKKELIKLIEATRKEKGCINYDLHQDNESPNRFLFYENWESFKLWQEHMKSPNLKAYKTATDGMIERLELSQMTKIK